MLHCSSLELPKKWHHASDFFIHLSNLCCSRRFFSPSLFTYCHFSMLEYIFNQQCSETEVAFRRNIHVWTKQLESHQKLSKNTSMLSSTESSSVSIASDSLQSTPTDTCPTTHPSRILSSFFVLLMFLCVVCRSDLPFQTSTSWMRMESCGLLIRA